jgi:TM2 domain-containing membrane protein YozV/ribosomal protein L40E
MTDVQTQQRGIDQRFCSDCGQVISARAEICPKCGVRQAGAQVQGEKSKIVAGILALLLGGIGIHKFYLGRIGQGILYILFCWTFIPSIIALIEGIIYLTMSDAKFAAKYG